MCIAVDPKNPIVVAEAPMGIAVVPKNTVGVAVNLKNPVDDAAVFHLKGAYVSNLRFCGKTFASVKKIFKTSF